MKKLGSWKISYSFRRRYIDHDLESFKTEFSGKVLDLGGKKNNKRGFFRPPVASKNWFYLNVNPDEKPDVLANGSQIPFQSETFDWVICAEVLEFIESPDLMMSEIARVLKCGGRLFLTSPFLFRIHDPAHDLQRFTRLKLEKLFQASKLEVVQVKVHGFFFTVLADFLKQSVAQIKSSVLRGLLGVIAIPILELLCLLDQLAIVQNSDFFSSYTTGYTFVGVKK